MPASRILVIGNSGAGKTWLAQRLAQRSGAPAIGLDTVHWEPGGYAVARDKAVAIAMLRQAAQAEAWVIEGVYGWLAETVADQATGLIWLDLAVEDCLANLAARGPGDGGDAAAHAALLAWAGDYGTRQTSSSFAGHARLFGAFAGIKARLRSRAEVAAYLG